MDNSGGSRTTFLAYQSPGAMSAGAFRQLELDANGAGPLAREASHAITAARANPAAKEITGTHISLAGTLAANNNTVNASSPSGSDDRARRAGDGFSITGGIMGAMAVAQFAAQQGVGWAKDKPELLNLGPEAIQAVADAKLTKASFERLEKDADFTAKEVVDLAKFAKKKDIDSNKLSNDVANLLRGLPSDERKKAHDGLTGYFAKPDDPKTGQTLDETFNGIKTAHPEKAKQVEELQKTLKRQTAVERTATAEAATKNAAKNDSYEALNASPATGEPAKAAPANKPEPAPAP